MILIEVMVLKLQSPSLPDRNQEKYFQFKKRFFYIFRKVKKCSNDRKIGFDKKDPKIR